MIIDAPISKDEKEEINFDQEESYAAPPPYVPPPVRSAPPQQKPRTQRPLPAGNTPSSSNGDRTLRNGHPTQPDKLISSHQHHRAATTPSANANLSPISPGGIHAQALRSASAIDITRITSGDIPPSFTRSPPRHIQYPPFQPIFLIASGRFLDRGFPPVAPPSNTRPHPFAVHDVNQGDWIRFLDEVRRAATLTEKQVSLAEDLPIVSLVPGINNLVAHAVKTHMKKNKAQAASQVVDTWNHHFFHPRRIEIILMKGSFRISGQNSVAIPNLHTPESVNFSMASVPGLNSTTSSSPSPSIDESASSTAAASSQTLKKGKERDKSGSKDDKDKTYRLFVVSMGT